MASILENRSVIVLCLILLLISIIQLSDGAVYKVGDSAGWTTIGNFDYKHWAATKTFQVGDIIVFKYNPQFHNVMRAIHAEYKVCNVSSPMSTHTTGNDSIIIDTHGHHFFLCGVPGHCQAGQKLDINVPRADLAASGPARSPASPVLAPAVVAVPAPSPSDAAQGHVLVLKKKFGWLLMMILHLSCVFGLS